jgi:hypothetical protein
MPAAQRAADKASLDSQRRTMNATRAQLLLLVLAAVAGAVPGTLGAVGAVIFFVLALAAMFYLATERPDRSWFRGRAGAESVKSLAWRYAIGGEPFPISGLSSRDVDQRFEEQLRAVCIALEDLSWTSDEGDDAQITPPMKALRATDLETRKAAYAAGRIADQEHWYASRSRRNERDTRRWSTLALLITFGGLIAGVVRIVHDYHVDLLALAAVAAASLTAWAETRQFRALATSYASAALELGTVSVRLPHIDSDAEWATFVRDAELAISREHTLWLTRRGIEV